MAKKKKSNKDEPIKVYGSFEDVIKISVTQKPEEKKINPVQKKKK